MMTLIAAAALAAQPAPQAQHPPMQHGQMAQHEQHEGMKMDCCKDCCKDMAKGEHEAQSQRGQ
jgi:hypothetical protein